MIDNEESRYLGSRYELLEVIGSGAMGKVWRARVRSDGTVGRRSSNQPDLAAKVLRQDLAADPAVVKRFVQERSVLMGLDHPGIVKVLDMVVEGDRLAIVMELLPGGTLAGALEERGTLPASVALPITCCVLDALGYAHSKGVLHRDIKPANVLLGAKGVDDLSGAKLSDFGIASFTDEQGVHATGLVGSPAYMPPELFSTGVVSAASDVYSTGVMLYELMGGRTPFAGSGTMHTVSFRHVTADPPPLPVPQQLWRVLEAMLSKDPGDRLSAGGAAQALRALPDAVWQMAALPVQPEPDWRAPANPVLPGRSKTIQAVDASVDLGQTRLTGPADLGEAKQIATGKAKAVVLSNTDVDDIGETRLGVFERPQPVAAVQPESEKKRPRWLIPLIAALAVSLVVGGIVVVMKTGLLNRTTAGPQSAAPSWVPAHVTGEPYATGLRVDLDAAPSAALPGDVSLTLTFTAPRSTGLSGDVLVVIPATGGDVCPSLAEPGLETATQSVDGVIESCAYKIPVDLDIGAKSELQVQVNGDLGDDLSAWLRSIVDGTRQALSSVTGPGFALQRVIGLDVSVDSLTRTEASPQVHYRVFADWMGGQQEIFRDDTLAFQATDLLRSLTGGAGLDGVQVQSCPETQVRGIAVLAQQAAAACYLQVTIGDLTSRQASFSIYSNGS